MRVLVILMSVAFNLLAQTDSLYVHLPDSVYTTTGSELSIFYTNLIRGRFENKEQIIVNCEVGYPDSMKYNLDFLQAGIYDFNIQVYDSLGFFIEEADTKIVVTDNSTAHLDTLKLLMIGDSFTYSGVYPKHIKELYESSTNYSIKLVGTSYNTGSSFFGLDNNIFHEGYSGRGRFNFANQEWSPFVFDGLLDIERYIKETLDGETPDFITIFLGVNDIGNAIDPATIESIDYGIDTKIFNFPRMSKLIESLVSDLPNVQIGIVLTPPLNEREHLYTTSYPELPNYWERKKLQHRLCQRYVDHFNDMGNPKISMIPANVSIDTYNGFNTFDSIHPNNYGYELLGNSIYSWIKYRISKWLTVPKGIELVNGDNYNTLTWNPSTGATSYRIYRSTDPYFGFVEIGTSLVPEFTDEDISGSDKYFYRVTAVDGSE